MVNNYYTWNLNDMKQVIIVRNDLRSKLRHGKLAAQVAHASMGACTMYSTIDYECGRPFLRVPLIDDQIDWWENNFTKVVLKCDTKEDLISLYDKALDMELNAALIKDSGDTVFSEPTITCVGIGPASEEDLNKLVGHLKLY